MRGRSRPLSATDWIKPLGGDYVPRLDIPAPKRVVNRIDLDDPEPAIGLEPVAADGEIQDFNEAVFGDAGLGPANDTASELDLGAAESEPEPSISASVSESTLAPDDVGDAVKRPEPPAAPRFTAADVTPVTEPIVEWPTDDQRRVVALRLVAPPPERLQGRALRLALASEGFVLGKFQIFHKPDSNGRAVLSAANLSKPGTFELETMDLQRFGGLSLFAVLPGPKPPLKAFEDLLATARNLNERLQGGLAG